MQAKLLKKLLAPRLTLLLLLVKLQLLLAKPLTPQLTLLHLRPPKFLPINFWLWNENRPLGRFFYACKKRSSRARASASRGSGWV